MHIRTILIGIGCVAVVAAGYYLVWPIFDTKRVDDKLPSAPTTTAEAGPSDTTTSPADTDAGPRVSPEPITLAHGAVIQTPGHPADGTVRIVETNGQRILRYENFETINGPQLHVYLATSKDADDYIDLGPIKGTEGNINYEIPDDVDLAKYTYALTWCEPFSVLFNYAQLR